MFLEITFFLQQNKSLLELTTSLILQYFIHFITSITCY